MTTAGGDTLTLSEAEGALADIDGSLARNRDEAEAMASARAVLIEEREQSEADERHAALRANRGDAVAQAVLDAATSRRRAIDDRLRHLAYALNDLDAEQRELADQRTVAEQSLKVARRAELAQQRMALARELDRDFAAVAAKMIRWRDQFIAITRLTKELQEPVGREIPFIWRGLLSLYLHDVMPLEFNILPPHLREHSTFVAMSRRFTLDEPDASGGEEA